MTFEVRDEVEALISDAVSRAVRSFLSRVVAAATGDTEHMVAAGSPAPSVTLGEFQGWWAAQVAQEVVNAVTEAWNYVYRKVSGGQVEATDRDAVKTYLAAVTDRLVNGLEPPIAHDSFDRVRVSVTQGLAQGWSRSETAARIAAELSWETNGEYWRGQYDAVGAEIDKILDPLGTPGSPAREFARLHDPKVKALQADRARARLALDQEQSYWKTRAERISRTEATGAHGYASLTALAHEGVAQKRWVCFHDGKTRESHLAADGQTVNLHSPFLVGGFSVLVPGDPTAPAKEVVNCRCILIGVEGEQATPGGNAEGLAASASPVVH